MEDLKNTKEGEEGKMKVQVLKQFGLDECTIVLQSGFVYTNILFHINSDDLVQFTDRTGETIIVEPDNIIAIKFKEDNNG